MRYSIKTTFYRNLAKGMPPQVHYYRFVREGTFSSFRLKGLRCCLRIYCFQQNWVNSPNVVIPFWSSSHEPHPIRNKRQKSVLISYWGSPPSRNKGMAAIVSNFHAFPRHISDSVYRHEILIKSP